MGVTLLRQVRKEWGTQDGVPGAYVMCGEGGDVYLNTREEFNENYQGCGPSMPHQYRKVR